MPQIVFPAPTTSELDSMEFGQWFEIVRRMINTPQFFAMPGDPGVTGVPNGTWGIWLNTTSGVLKLWANQNNTMKSITLT